jgi:outer membrane protein assembly factor BamE (lipoprotein component of BamABCDE complex)
MWWDFFTIHGVSHNQSHGKERSDMRLKTMAVIAGMLMSLCGCLSVGRPFESDDLSWIHKNKTAKDDVYDELGEPFRVGSDSGKLTWTYGYYKYSAFGSTRTKDLVIYFNKDGTVESYVFSTSFPEEKEIWREKK